MFKKNEVSSMLRKVAVLFAMVITVAAFTIPGMAYTEGYDGMGPKVIEGGMRDFVWPVPEYNNLQSCFYDTRNHMALDISAPTGTQIVASFDGTVVATETTQTYATSGYGNYVVVEHNYVLGTGERITLYSKYNHMSSVTVNVGDPVSGGKTKLGEVGSSGKTEGPHLDFQIFYGEWGNNSCSIDPYSNELLEMPAGLLVYDSWACGKEYYNLASKLYETPLSYSHITIPDGVVQTSLKLSVTRKNGTVVRTGAGNKEPITRRLQKGTVVSAIGYTVNKWGNVWYYLEDGTYVFGKNVAIESAQSTAQITGVSAPSGNLPSGGIYVLKGNVTSSCNRLVQITATVKTESGNVVLEATDCVDGQYSLQSSALDKAMTFNTLPGGSYVYEITVEEDVDTGTMCMPLHTVLYTSNFTVS